MSGEITITIPADASPERMQAILQAAGQDAVVAQAASQAAPTADPEQAVGWAASAFDRAIQNFAGFPAALEGGVAAFRAETGMAPLAVLAIALALLAAAYGVELAVRRLTPARGANFGPSFGDRFAASVSWLVGRIGSLVVFALAAIVLSRLFLPGGMARQIFTIALSIVLLQRSLYVVFAFISAPGEPHRRLAGMSDAETGRVARIMIAMLSITAALRIFGAGIAALTGGGPEDDLLQIGVILLWFIAVAFALVAVRAEYAGLIRREWGGLRVFGRSVSDLASYWHVLGIALALATAVAGVGMIVGMEQSGGFSGSFLIFAITPFVIAGISGLKREKVAAAPRERRPALEGWFALAEGGALILAAILLLRTWSIDPFDAENAEGLAALAPAVVSSAVAIIIGVSIWRAAKAFIASYQPIAEVEGDDGDDGLGKEGSRIGTMLPVLRGFLFALIVAVTVMVALSALGVNVGPMIAGAGIFGLAIGFGSQKLVADVISGFFYLYEDAFRVGEYIETDEGKGVVENISIRSARLRHHRGPVFTVPFSSMGTVQNHSRDWVKIKFTFQVPVDTDVEKVRKLVKKVGEKLLDDPELEGKFIEPMKSQGAVAIKGHSFEIGVKYMSKPGQQFLIRRKAYAALQKAFEENGIELYRPAIALEAQDALEETGLAADRPS